MFNPSTLDPVQAAGQKASPNISQIWTPISATNFACFGELADDFDVEQRSENSQKILGVNSTRQQETIARLEQDLLDEKQMELARFTSRLNALQEKCVAEILDQEQVLAQRLLDLAIRLAEKVVRAHFFVDKSALLPLIEEALSQILPGDSNVKLSVNPADAELVSQTFNDELKEGRFSFISDAGLSPGSCQIHSDYSAIDNSLMMRWEKMIHETGLIENHRIESETV